MNVDIMVSKSCLTSSLSFVNTTMMLEFLFVYTFLIEVCMTKTIFVDFLLFHTDFVD